MEPLFQPLVERGLARPRRPPISLRLRFRMFLLQVVGFAVILFGAAIYNKILHVPFLSHDSPADSVPPVILHTPDTSDDDAFPLQVPGDFILHLPSIDDLISAGGDKWQAVSHT